MAWGAGKGNFFGTWPLVWHHLIDTPGSKKFVADFTKKYNKPPENQAWGDYIALEDPRAGDERDQDRSRRPRSSSTSRRAPKFDLLKTREGYFRPYDHQLMHEMYAVEALKASELKNQWDIYKPSAPVPGPNEPLEVIAATKEENVCKIGCVRQRIASLHSEAASAAS